MMIIRDRGRVRGAARPDRRRGGHGRRALGAALAMALLPALAAAQAAGERSAQPQPIPRLSVSMQIGDVPGFDVAGSTSRVDGDAIRSDRPGVQLSESLGGVPGLLIQDRHNFAQDLQLSVRGFGARSTFGVRGVRLYVDGIPATLPDGQGQTSNIALGSVDRVEVLRGPFSALYGNSSGGVVQVFTEDGAGAPKAEVSLLGGSWGSERSRAKFSGGGDRFSYLVSAGHFHTDGWRRHSAADRDNVNAKFGYQLDGGDKLTLVTNYVRARAQDPLGVTAEQARLDPREGSRALAEQYDTHKDIAQTQAGLTWEHNVNFNNKLRLMAYAGRRNMLQFLSIPAAPQANPTHSGGVVGFQRDYAGADLRWISHTQLAARPLDVVAGLAWDNLREDRRGWENFVGSVGAPSYGGQQGQLRRDERNRVYNLDPYVQGTWKLAERWQLEAGLRRSSVHFSSRDHYIVGANGDDSYSARYSQWLPTASVRFQPGPDLALYAAVGHGFETPTLNELAYQAGGGGVNTSLRPATNNSLELGLKARLGRGYLTAAVFQTDTRDEIVTRASSGGRATYQNASRTRRRGVELSWNHETRSHWRTQVAYTLLDATYRRTFCPARSCGADDLVRAGNRIPGIARQVLYASLAWMPPQGWHAGAELRAISRLYADDRNTAHAPGYMTTALHAGYTRTVNRWDLNAFARVDNLFDRRTIGSVIVNDGNGRYFEPAPGRSWTVGLSAAYRF